MRVLFSLGSNMALQRASGALTSCEVLMAASYKMTSYVSGMRCSSIYRTAPMYVVSQDDFFNMAVTGAVQLTPHELLDAIHETEHCFGRDRAHETRNGPRTLDIDIVYIDGESVHDKDLEVPHPRMTERAFVLVPSIEILQNDDNWDRAIVSLMKAALVGCSGQRVQKTEQSRMNATERNDDDNKTNY